MHSLNFAMQPSGSTEYRDSTPVDERWIPVRTNVELDVVEVYPGFGSAWATDEQGERFVINYKSDGVDVTRLTVGQHLSGSVSRFGFVISASTP